MLKAKLTNAETGEETFLIGLSFANLRKFLAEPLKTVIHIDGKEHGLPFSIDIISAPTEQDFYQFFKPQITKDTTLIIDKDAQ